VEVAAGSHARARVGSVLDGKWTLETLLGVGGMAAVYAARHRNGARAAVKLLHADLARHADVRERFRREGYAANRVEHPGAVRVLDDDIVTTGVDAGTAYLVMELLEGESMQDRVERAPMMDELEFLHIASAVLDVLKAAHARGVVHRDLKPENIFLVAAEKAASAGARVKVLDFGLARLLDGQAITTYGLALGTPSFMSPEQAGGRIDEIDGRTDLFALAATGFRLRAGRRIHEARNPVDLVSKMASLPAPRLREVAGDVSDAYARVIDRALEFRRDDRYESAAAMKDDVERALAELDPSVATTQLAIPPAPPSRASPPPPDRRARRRARSILPWVALLLFGGIGGGLWQSARGPSARAPAPPPGVDAAIASVSPSAPSGAVPFEDAAPHGSSSAGASTRAAAPAAASPPASAGPRAAPAPGAATSARSQGVAKPVPTALKPPTRKKASAAVH
jgi:serine/threonine-protein kinase